MTTLRQRARDEKHPSPLQKAIVQGEKRLIPLTDEEFKASMLQAALRAFKRGIKVYFTKTGGISIYPGDAAEV